MSLPISLNLRVTEVQESHKILRTLFLNETARADSNYQYNLFIVCRVLFLCSAIVFVHAAGAVHKSAVRINRCREKKMLCTVTSCDIYESTICQFVRNRLRQTNQATNVQSICKIWRNTAEI